MNYEGLPEPAIELLFWYLPIDICLILHNKYKFPKELWRDKVRKEYKMEPEEGAGAQGYLKPNANESFDRFRASIYAGVDEKTLLHIYTNLHSYIRVKFMIDNGFDINAEDISGRTALHYESLSSKDYRMAKMLLDNGIDVNARNSLGQSAIHCTMRNKEYLKLLLDYGANINEVDELGNTRLHYACMEHDIKEVRILCKNKADCFIKNEDGKIPLDYSGYEPRIRTILIYGLLNICIPNKNEIDKMFEDFY